MKRPTPQREAQPMNEAERKAVLLLGDAWNALLECGVTGPEPCAHIHALQHAVMARTAQRLHPEIFRQDVPVSAPERPLPPQMRLLCSGASLLPDWLLRRLGKPVPGTIRLKPR